MQRSCAGSDRCSIRERGETAVARLALNGLTPRLFLQTSRGRWEVRRVAEEILPRRRAIDVLVNNAGACSTRFM